MGIVVAEPCAPPAVPAPWVPAEDRSLILGRNRPEAARGSGRALLAGVVAGLLVVAGSVAVCRVLARGDVATLSTVGQLAVVTVWVAAGIGVLALAWEIGHLVVQIVELGIDLHRWRRYDRRRVRAIRAATGSVVWLGRLDDTRRDLLATAAADVDDLEPALSPEELVEAREGLWHAARAAYRATALEAVLADRSLDEPVFDDAEAARHRVRRDTARQRLLSLDAEIDQVRTHLARMRGRLVRAALAVDDEEGEI